MWLALLVLWLADPVCIVWSDPKEDKLLYERVSLDALHHTVWAKLDAARTSGVLDHVLAPLVGLRVARQQPPGVPAHLAWLIRACRQSATVVAAALFAAGRHFDIETEVSGYGAEITDAQLASLHKGVAARRLAHTQHVDSLAVLSHKAPEPWQRVACVRGVLHIIVGYTL